MNWGAFDLNLLIVFDAVMQERSVTRAGSRIGLSQPAMSHALNRLRHMLKDELFVRTPEGMAPTARAEMLALPLRKALSEMQLALEPASFDPASSDRRFALALNNYAAVVLAPPLVAATLAAAPAVHLDLRPSGTLDIVDRLDRGDIDLAIGGPAGQGTRFAAAPLFEDPYVLVMRRGHPASRQKLTAKTLGAIPHLEISSSREDTSFIDQWLASHSTQRRVALRAPYLSARGDSRADRHGGDALPPRCAGTGQRPSPANQRISVRRCRACARRCRGIGGSTATLRIGGCGRWSPPLQAASRPQCAA